MSEIANRPTSEPVPVSPPGDADAQAQEYAQRPFPLVTTFMGLLIVLLFTGSLAAWSSLAPIEGAVVAQGIINVAGFRKQVQHLEGGIVDDILVRDGDKVAEGQVLVQLRDVRPAAELRQLEGRYVEVQAVIARLFAERDDRAEIEFPDELLEREDERGVRSALRAQRSILESHNAVMKERLAVIEKKIAQARAQIEGLLDREKVKEHQKALVLQELELFEEAISKSVIPKAEGLELQQRLAKDKDDLIAYQTEIDQLQQSILELQLQMSETREQRLAEVKEELHTQRATLFELSQEIIAARDVLERTRIPAPIDGVVVNLQVHSNDGVIEPGELLMEIVPANDDLVVDALVDPTDIDEVWAGMPADVRLTSLSRRQRMPMEGVVTDVSADRLTDPQTGEDYYRARIELSPQSLATSKVTLVAGMGADVFLRTGARTPLDYLVSPLTKSFLQGLREK